MITWIRQSHILVLSAQIVGADNFLLIKHKTHVQLSTYIHTNFLIKLRPVSTNGTVGIGSANFYNEMNVEIRLPIKLYKMKEKHYKKTCLFQLTVPPSFETF